MSLIELMVAVGIGGIVTLGIAGVFSYGIQQFQLLVDQNKTEESLLLASYYTRFYLTNALDTGCGAVAPTWSFPNPQYQTPAANPQGRVHCALTDSTGGSWPVMMPNTSGLFAIFFRESGGADATDPNGIAYSDIRPSAVAFRPPCSTATDATCLADPKSGRLYFVSAPAGGGLALTDGGLWFDRLVDFAIQGTPRSSGNGRLQSLDIHIIARYFKSTTGRRGYERFATNMSGQMTANGLQANYRDVDMVVSVGFRDNALGNSLTGMNQQERLHGGLYYFRTFLPQMNF
jgi:type II secretory pathway pseudopilin PulG